MNTIITLIIFLTVIQAIAHLRYMSRALSFDLWDLFFPFRAVKEIFPMIFILIAAEAITFAISTDVYGKSLDEIDDPRAGKNILFLFVLLAWSGLSIYQYLRRRRVAHRVKDNRVDIAPLALQQSGLTKAVLSSVITFISIISAVLGIVDFYLDHLR
jgi:hypothetical protein